MFAEKASEGVPDVMKQFLAKPQTPAIPAEVVPEPPAGGDSVKPTQPATEAEDANKLGTRYTPLPPIAVKSPSDSSSSN